MTPHMFLPRCFGRNSTAAHIPGAPTAALGFTRRRNVHQLQQPSPKDHRRRFPLAFPSPVDLPFDDDTTRLSFLGEAASAADFAAARRTRAPGVSEEGCLAVGLGFSNNPSDMGDGGWVEGAASERSVIAANIEGWKSSLDVDVTAASGAGEAHLSAAARPETDLVVANDTGVAGRLGTLRRLRPRRECGRGRR